MHHVFAFNFYLNKQVITFLATIFKKLICFDQTKAIFFYIKKVRVLLMTEHADKHIAAFGLQVTD